MEFLTGARRPSGSEHFRSPTARQQGNKVVTRKLFTTAHWLIRHKVPEALIVAAVTLLLIFAIGSAVGVD